MDSTKGGQFDTFRLVFFDNGGFFVYFDVGEEISAVFFPLAMLSQYIFGPALFLISLFIVLIILLQRGRGGGLTGALGGAGGASAFGVKAGDIFTRITAVSVLLWIVLCALTCFWYLPPKLDIAANSADLSKVNSPADMGMSGVGTDLATPTTTPTVDTPTLDNSAVGTPTLDNSAPGVGSVPIEIAPATNLPEANSTTEEKP